MRPRSTLVACVLLVALASGPAAQRQAAGLPAEPGPDILRLSPAELWPLLEACADGASAAQSSDEEAVAVFVDEGTGFDSGSEGMQEWMRRGRCGSIGQELARRGGDAYREALWVVFDDPATDDEVRTGVVRGMLEARLEEASAGPAGPTPPSGRDPRSPDPLRAPMPARHARLASDLDEPREPEWSGDAAAELRAAYRRATSARRAYFHARLVLAGEQPASFVAERAGFFEAVAEYLRGRVSAAEALLRIGRYEWGSWCGTGSDVFDEPRDRALLLILLELGRHDLAAGALLAIADGEQRSAAASVPDGERPAPAWLRLAERLGLDWEELVIGSLLDRSWAGAESVAVHGTPRGARLLLHALDQRAPHGGGGEAIGDSEAALATAAALVTRGSGCDGFARSSLDLDRAAGELLGDLQAEALEAIAARAVDEAGLELAREAARQLHRLCRVESVPAFEAMSRSVFGAVRREARDALRALAGAEPEIESAPGVVFRVRVDGTPWQGALQASVRRRPHTTTQTLETDATGQLSLDRDLFVDPKRPVEAVRLELSRFGGASDTWFGADVGPPADLAAVAELSVDTQRVVLELPAAHAGPCAASPCTVRLEAETRLEREGDADWSPADGAAEGYRFFERVTADRLLRADGSWSVRLGRASRYRAVLSAGVAGSWTSPVVELGAAPVTLTLRGDLLRSFAELSEDEDADLAPEE
jgi:hypothetical protein